MPRRHREIVQAQQQQQQKGEEITTPPNEAAISTTSSSSSNTSSSDDDHFDVTGNNNPLLKIVFIQRVLFYMKRTYFDPPRVRDEDSDDYYQSRQTLHEYIELREVSSTWHETIDFYSHIPSKIIRRFSSNYLQLGIEINSDLEREPEAAMAALICISKFVRDSSAAQAWMKDFLRFGEPFYEQAVIPCTEDLRDAFIAMCKFVKGETGVLSVYEFIEKVTVSYYPPQGEYYDPEEDFRVLFATSEMCVCLVSLSKEINDPDSSSLWCRSLANLTELRKSQQVFGTEQIFRCLVEVSKQFRYSLQWCRAFANLTEIESNQNLFFPEECRHHRRDSCLKIFSFVNGEYHASECVRLLHNLTYKNDSNKQLFSTEAARDVIFNVLKHINYDCDDVYYCCRIIVALTEVNPKLFCVTQAPQQILALGQNKKNNLSPESICFFMDALKTMLKIDKNFFQTTSAEIHQLCGELKSMMNDDEKMKNLSTKLFAPEAHEKVYGYGQEYDKEKKLGYGPNYKKKERESVNKNYVENSLQLIVEIETLLK